MPSDSFFRALAATVVVLVSIVGFPAGGGAQRADTAELRVLAQQLPPEIRENAESYLAASDTTERVNALRRLLQSAQIAAVRGQADPGAADFAVAALRQEPYAHVRDVGIGDMASFPVTKSHEGFRDALAELMASDSDSVVAQRAYTELQKLRGEDDFAVIQGRVHQARAVGRVPDWLLRLEQVTSDKRFGIVLPRFMREAPSVFSALPANQPIRVLAFGDYGTGDDAQRKVAKAMRGYHAKTPFMLGITLGDNFYSFPQPESAEIPRPESPESPRWKWGFEDLYGVMGFPIYAALGNHDFDVPDQAAAEWVYSRRSETWNLPALYYTYTAGYAQILRPRRHGTDRRTARLAR